MFSSCKETICCFALNNSEYNMGVINCSVFGYWFVIYLNDSHKKKTINCNKIVKVKRI